MGLSGSGKSTLIRHFNRLIDPTQGKITVEGIDVMSLNTKELEEFRRHKMSMVFQRFGLMPHRTVVENVAYGLEVQGIKKEDRLAKANEWLETVGLKGYGNQYPLNSLVVSNNVSVYHELYVPTLKFYLWMKLSRRWTL